MKRHCYKCLDCLSVFFIEGDKPAKLACACGGPADWMGRVQGTRVLKEEERCPCDERCTHARGPQCDCPCGAVNHGTGKVVTVVVESHAIPRAANEASTERRDEYHAAVKAARARIRARFGTLVDDVETRVWVPDRYLWGQVNYALGRLHAARKLRTHGKRLEALAAIEPEA